MIQARGRGRSFGEKNSSRTAKLSSGSSQSSSSAPPCQGDCWRTPKHIYALLDKEFHFNFDPCPYPRPQWDGLLIDWKSHNFVNPPYSETEKWVKKALEERKKGNISVMLLRLDASTVWFRDLVLPHAEIRLFEDRLHFINTQGIASRSNFASILAIFKNAHETVNLPVIYWRGTP